jgi:hypothetical protein
MEDFDGDFIVIPGWFDDGVDSLNIRHFDNKINAEDYAQWCFTEVENNYDYSHVIAIGMPNECCIELSHYVKPSP